MKKYILFPLFAVAIMCFSSCHSQKGRMDDLKDFVEKIQEEGKDYTLDQWKEANERFQKLLVINLLIEHEKFPEGKSVHIIW